MGGLRRLNSSFWKGEKLEQAIMVSGNKIYIMNLQVLQLCNSCLTDKVLWKNFKLTKVQIGIFFDGFTTGAP